MEDRSLITAAVEALPMKAEFLVTEWKAGNLDLVKESVCAIRRTLQAAEERIKADLWRNLGG
ncbi:MAG: hypothetical protein V3T26_05955 [candidate division NC10 bacterium]